MANASTFTTSPGDGIPCDSNCLPTYRGLLYLRRTGSSGYSFTWESTNQSSASLFSTTVTHLYHSINHRIVQQPAISCQPSIGVSTEATRRLLKRHRPLPLRRVSKSCRGGVAYKTSRHRGCTRHINHGKGINNGNSHQATYLALSISMVLRLRHQHMATLVRHRPM